MKKVLVVQYEGRTLRLKVVEVPKDKTFFEFLYETIGCERVEIVYFDGYDAWVDEEGLYNSGSPVFKYGNPAVPLAGNLVFTKGIDDKGNTTFFDSDDDLDNQTLLKIIGMVSEARYVGEVK